jgi:phosphonopyruvate decarboxylase
VIEPIEFIEALQELDIRFVTGVPDSLLKDFCACIAAHFSPPRHVIATNEGSAVGLSIGHYLATGRPALVYMQNSGLGNAVNPLTSLVDSQVYAIPVIIMIGWRGEILEDGQQLRDEPQHVKQGQITLRQLEVLGIPYRILDSTVQTIGPMLHDLVHLALSRSGPTALVVRKGSFSPFKSAGADETENLLTREAAISRVVASIPCDVPIVSTTGMASRELFEMRKASQQGHSRDFLTVGGMGHAGQIAAGIAMARPDRQVACIDGDGAILMHMGALAISADCPNLLHILINNGAHDSVGGQPTKGTVLDFSRIAAECGYKRTSRVSVTDEITATVLSMIGCQSSSFLEIKCKRGGRANLGRPDRTPAQNKSDLMLFLEEGL